MDKQKYRWSNKQIRNHVKVLNEEISPPIILKNATYLNTYLRKWDVANIWIYEDRIVYVGEKLPENLDKSEVINCQGHYLVPGYIGRMHTLASYTIRSHSQSMGSSLGLRHSFAII